MTVIPAANGITQESCPYTLIAGAEELFTAVLVLVLLLVLLVVVVLLDEPDWYVVLDSYPPVIAVLEPALLDCVLVFAPDEVT